MKRLHLFWVLMLVSGCSLFTKQNARTALNFVEMTCILAQSPALSTEEVKAVCGIVDDLAPALRDLLKAQQMSGKRCQ